MNVVDADDAGRSVCKHGFGDVVRDAEADSPERTTRRRSWFVQFGSVDVVMILAATAGHRLQRPQHAPVQIALDRAGHLQRPLARVEAEQERAAPDSAAAMR